MRSNQLKLAQQTQGGRQVANPALVKAVAKQVLRATLHHTSWNAMYNSKQWLRKAAVTGSYNDLPAWLRSRLYNLYLRVCNTKHPSGLRVM